MPAIAGTAHMGHVFKLVHKAKAALNVLQETLIQRVQQPSFGPSLTVENSGQTALVDMLYEAAAQPKASSSMTHAMEWAQHFTETPASWYGLVFVHLV